MPAVPAQFKLSLAPAAAPGAVVTLANARFTVLTERLIRLEVHPEGRFEDRASQAFWYRAQPVPEFVARPQGEYAVEIETAALRLTYNAAAGEGFTPETLSILVKSTGTVWTPGLADAGNLRGTTRTLDFINGYVPLLPGLMSRAGWSVLDDSATLVLNDESWLEPRIPGGTDLYFFGAGHDYRTCLRDYCAVSGQMPLIPRWILGNWWSRYWHYTQDELTTLINDFKAYELPLSVCIIDMDWHITKTGNTSSGWTGYTWNRELFPDPKGFFDFAHSRKLKVSMNLHPADGVHPHEEYYAEMARRTGIDPATGEPVKFNITDPAFADAYFEVLHRPHEKMGVDFWWIDWQQGLTSALPGLDPLWLVNHLHFLDQGRDGTRRPFIFSRWGNEGHQRYPIGFSGDSYATWDTLAFQPYMTSTASNIAYGWWSHDIGGHISGTEDPELFARWVQYGALSPINRLHVTKGEFYDRRPWLFGNAEILRVVREAMQFRHALVPYLYTMARRASTETAPLIQPMYYEYPEEEAAYHAPQQYLFGSELIAAPYVSPADPHTGLSRQVVWLPEGDWTHFFSGQHFSGGWHSLYGRLDDIPLFAKAGAIVPLAADTAQFGTDNPESLHIHVFAGADHRFDLYEDDGESTAYQQGRSCVTALTQKWQGSRLDFTISAPVGDATLIPDSRDYTVSIHGIRAGAQVSAVSGSGAHSPTAHYDAQTETLVIEGLRVSADGPLTLTVSTDTATLLSRRDRTRETLMRLLKAFKLNTGVRNRIADTLDAVIADPAELAPCMLPMAESQARALFETLYDAGLHHVSDTHHPDLLIVWNNRENPQITYRYAEAYLWFGQFMDPKHSRGVVPRFAHFVPSAKNWTHGAQDEHVHRAQFRAQIDYAGLYAFTIARTEQTP